MCQILIHLKVYGQIQPKILSNLNIPCRLKLVFNANHGTFTLELKVAKSMKRMVKFRIGTFDPVTLT